MSKRNKADRGPLTPKRKSIEFLNQIVIDSGDGIKLVVVPLNENGPTLLQRSGRDAPEETRLRQAILDRNLKSIEVAAVQARTRGDKDFAYLVHELRQNRNLSPELQDFVRTSKANGQIPTQLLEMPRQQLYKGLRAFQEDFHKEDSREPLRSEIVELLSKPASENCFWVVVLACRGKLSTELKMPV